MQLVQQMENLEKLLEKDRYKKYHFIEVMNCKGGCVGGGGQPLNTIPKMDEIKKVRLEGLYNIDDNVTKLVNMYEDNLDTAGEEWLDEVQDYFKNYNNIEDKNAKALELINKFSDNDKTKTNIWEIILVVGLAVILLKLSFTGKKKKRKKRKRRK